ncbi:MAG: hypothetical protein IT430_09830 [Phycisphaerales bacterium]|nr:hypothetical protein [Phycisphaerales bacterium]
MTPEEINAAIQKSVTDALKPITTQLATFSESIKPIAALQEQVKGLVEADSAKTIEGKGKAPEKGKETDAAATGAGLTTEAATALFQKMLADRDTAAQTTAQQQAAHEAWIKKNASKLAGTPTGKRIFAGCKTDEERKAALDEYVADLKASGVKAPDLGATAEGEGGAATAADTAEAKKAAALEAAKGLKPVTL